MSSVISSFSAGVAVFTELFEINSKSVKSCKNDKRNCKANGNPDCNQRAQSFLLTGLSFRAERANHV